MGGEEVGIALTLVEIGAALAAAVGLLGHLTPLAGAPPRDRWRRRLAVAVVLAVLAGIAAWVALAPLLLTR